MTIYQSAHRIYVGQWMFFPELLIARNTHNGSPVYFHRRLSGEWVATGCNIPADWMMKEICDWFAKWINGEVAPSPTSAEREP